MSAEMQRIRALFKVQAKEFKRDFGAMFFSFVFPMFFVVLLVVTSLMTPTYKFEFGVVDPGGNPSARKLVEALASDYMSVSSVTRAQAEKELTEGKLQAALILPREDLVSGGGVIEVIAGERSEGFARLAMEAARSRLLHQDGSGPQPYQFKVVAPQGKASSKFSFLYPGMLALALLQLGLFATATPLLRDRERGTLRHLLLTPMHIKELLISQVSFRFIIALVQVSILLAAGMFVVDLGALQWIQVLAISCLGAVMLICVGYALAGLAPTLEGGMAIIMIVNFAMLFGGNVFADPASSRILWIVAHFFPVSYLADAYRQVINQTAGLWPMWLDLCALVVWSGLAFLVAARTFRFDMGQDERRRGVAPVASQPA